VAGPPRFVTVAALADLPRGASRAVWVGDVPVALFNVAGMVYAIDNVCPHAGGPLAGGKLGGPCGELVTCPWHGWRFNVRTGVSLDLPGEQVRTFPVRVVEGAVEVGVDGGSDSVRFGDVHKP
jgi:nitrite reductase (NADH) small subunit/3-phenylpropionate/trans-cinnamate dioxygenase ferredoxin subunit